MNQTAKKFIVSGSLFMALSVVLGAFGAHGLRGVISEEMLKVYHTGVEYQFYHSLGLFVVAFVSNFNESKIVRLSGYFMILGIVLFSGSLYLLSTLGIGWIGAITPVGGLSFIVAWILLAFGVRKSDAHIS